MKKINFFAIAFLMAVLIAPAWSQIPFSRGRIAISSDGNMHDNDDWGATAASLALLAKAGLQNSLVLYTYSDHIWGSENNDRAEMRESAVGGGNRWGFSNTRFIEAVANVENAYNAMRDAINASSASNPLFIICAGPMQVVGTGMSRANANKRQHVTLISHSLWNNRHSDTPSGGESHSGWTWDEMKNSFSNARFIKIKDQNSPNSQNGFNTERAGPNGARDWNSWNWMRDSGDANVRWIYSRMRKLGRPDISDCGMIWYLIRNDENGNIQKMRNFIGNGISNGGNPPPPPPTGGGNSGAPIGKTIWLKANNGAAGYVVAERGISGAPLRANRNAIGQWEKFKVENAGNGKVHFKALANNKYVQARISDGGKMLANTNNKLGWETFTWESRGNGKVALKAFNNKYVQARLNLATNELAAIADNVQGWETFNWGETSGNKILETANEAVEISIFPNPVNLPSKVTIKNTTEGDVAIIHDASGAVIASQTIDSNNQIDVNDLSIGIYFVKVNTKSMKLIVD
ncbi:T9SS type A sorting domain-containing protein [Aquimarina agarilytica]|uniref:T9SS type A sorting domain-containing protein n=1 Tax=Aquimarina agarilytica TaxID=1087449 RepID=UPI000287F730|nr:T9SS type A sorting domain-containing protein [Aquimarina agarilytica]